ncbi:hypothetical protein DB41_EU00050 [Neochlamydia sp. TUME1]|nr:hypothetical protein DB41_EU00050 [Neochlamydia sp. TUME1]
MNPFFCKKDDALREKNLWIGYQTKSSFNLNTIKILISGSYPLPVSIHFKDKIAD